MESNLIMTICVLTTFFSLQLFCVVKDFWCFLVDDNVICRTLGPVRIIGVCYNSVCEMKILENPLQVVCAHEIVVSVCSGSVWAYASVDPAFSIPVSIFMTPVLHPKNEVLLLYALMSSIGRVNLNGIVSGVCAYMASIPPCR